MGIGQPEKQPGMLTHRRSHHCPRGTRPVCGRTVPRQVAWRKPSCLEEHIAQPWRSSSSHSLDRQGQGWRRNLLQARSKPCGLHLDCPPAPLIEDLAPHNCLGGTTQKHVFPFLPLFKVLHTFTDHFLSSLKILVISH